MGRVFLAEDPSLHRRVAIKVLPPEFTHDKERRERLVHEARAASALNHPNIVVVHDLGESDGALFVAMELVDGQTLREWARAKPRSPVEVLSTIRQAAAALQAAHAAGLVHRDLKPENMLVRKDGILKILDFGLARSVTPEEGRTLTTPGIVLGTAPYMSPEQVLGRPAGPASDLFSLGTILYELLTGKHPFTADSAVEIMHRILHETPEAPSKVNRALSSDFDFVLAKALSKDPSRRHGSARDLDVDLEALEGGFGASAPSGAPGGKGPRAIAVLPFKNIGGNPDFNYLGVGLADAVITRLMNSPDLVVRSTGSIAVYENQPVEPKRVGQELDVTAVLDSSFQRAGDRFRATARLVETPSGRALWAGKLDLRFEDIFEVQDQVAHGIAEALTARLTDARAAGGSSGAPGFTPSPEAYEAFLRGTDNQREATREGNLRAIREYERAVALEPNFAAAWAQLASTMHTMIDGGYDSNPKWYVKAEEAVARARAIDPENGPAHFATAQLHMVFGRKRESYRELLAARRTMPNHSHTYHYVAYLFRLCNMIDEALRAEQHAVDLEPNAPFAQTGMVRNHLLRRDYAAAESWIERAQIRFPSYDRFRVLKGRMLLDQGKERETQELLERGTPKDDGDAYFVRAFTRLRLGDVDGAREDVPQIEAYGEVDMDFAANAASIWAHLGDRDKAFRFLDRAVELGNDTLMCFENPTFFAPLHTDPRWEAFRDAMRRRIEGYRREFRWPLPD
jgi:serine/threonine-protein kinase